MRKLTQEEFERRVPTSVIVHGQYESGRARINVECDLCGHCWSPVARSLINGHGCPVCGQQKAKDATKWNISQEKFFSKIPNELSDTLTVLGSYVSCNHSIEVECKTCGNRWDSKPVYLYKGHGCNKCSRKQKGLRSRISHVDYVAMVNDVHHGNIKVLGKYTTGKQRIDVKCLECEHCWQPVARRLQRRGCPRCCFSKGERKIAKLLEHHGVVFETEYVFDDLVSPSGGKLRFDFAVFKEGKFSHLLEYDGPQHFKAVDHFGGKKRLLIQQRNDKIKNQYCDRKTIRLIRIPYTDYGKIELGNLL